MVVLIGKPAEIGIVFDLFDREREFGFAVGVRALPDPADLKLEAFWRLSEHAVRWSFFVVGVEGYCRDLDVVGKGGNPTVAFGVCDVVAFELDEVGELGGHGSVLCLGCDGRSQARR